MKQQSRNINYESTENMRKPRKESYTWDQADRLERAPVRGQGKRPGYVAT